MGEKLFITFDSNTQGYCSNLDPHFFFFSNSLRGTSCYLINGECANFLLNGIYPLLYQIDIKIGMLLKGKGSRCLYIIDSGIKQDKSYPSDVQYFFISKDEIRSVLRLPKNIIDLIHFHLPKKIDLNQGYMGQYGWVDYDYAGPHSYISNYLPNDYIIPASH